MSANDLGWLDTYNIVWSSPSKNSGESMPVGGDAIELNVWVEDGDVLSRDGKIVKVAITPESRRNDVILLDTR
jgi:hypothetical protein